MCGLQVAKAEAQSTRQTTRTGCQERTRATWKQEARAPPGHQQSGKDPVSPSTSQKRIYKQKEPPLVRSDPSAKQPMKKETWEQCTAS